MIFHNNSTLTNIQPWFIPLDILMIICTIFSVILALIFLFTIIIDKTCHTVPIILVANSCLAELIFGSDMVAMALFTFHNDIKQIHYQDSFCIFRGFIGYVMTVIHNYSYLLQSIYRFLIIVHPTRLTWRSAKFQISLISLTWIWGFIGPLPYLFTNQIKYNVDNQICQMPLQLSFLSIYNGLIVYTIPISLIVFIYLKLVRHVKRISKNITPVNIILRAQRELQMVQRIVILVLVVTTVGFPYAAFVFMAFFTTPPRYHFRIAYLFVDVSITFVMIALYQFTEPLKRSIMKKMNIEGNMVLSPILRKRSLNVTEQENIH